MPPPVQADDGEIKKSRASLVGGVAVGLGVLALWTALAVDLGVGGFSAIAPGVIVATLIGLWIWRADL
jgi:hypothetical protein